MSFSRHRFTSSELALVRAVPRLSTRIVLLAAVAASLAAPVTAQVANLINFGENWRYFRGTVAPSTPPEMWRDPLFVDTSWQSGPTGIGYGDGDDATTLADMQMTGVQPGYLSVFCRRSFNLTAGQLSSFTSLLLAVDYDDGFIAFLNGTEVARSASMGVTGTEFAFDQASAGQREAGTVEYFDLTASLGLLAAGTNVLAVQVHNANLTSSDLSFNARLSANDPRLDCPTGLACTKDVFSVTLAWTNSPTAVYDSVSVTRNGAPIPGSPFAGSTTTVTDNNPGTFINTYDVVATINGVNCDPLSCTTTNQFTLIDTNEVWKFFRGTVAPSTPATAWREPGFADGAWEEGATGIGYGDADDATELTDMEGNYVTVYCRKAFDIPDPGVFQNLFLEVNYDDGIIAYLNGTEVARSASMGVAGTEFAFDQAAPGQREAGAFQRFDLTPFIASGDVIAGGNVLAVEVHNNALASTDLSFIPRLLGNECSISGLTCTFDAASGDVTISFASIPSDEIEITRNGTPLPGSPFPGSTTMIVDTNPVANDNVYQVLATVGGQVCPAATCTVTCGVRDPDALTCGLTLAADGAGGFATQGNLSWTTPPGTTGITVQREGALLATLPASANGYTDTNVESAMAEDDTDYSVVFASAGGTCTITCGPLSLCPQNFSCEVVEQGGVQRARLTWTNVVKEWASFTVQRDGADLATGLPGSSTTFTDTVNALVPGVLNTYTLLPIAPAGEEVGTACDASCTISGQVPELASYLPPAGGWDYSIDFESSTQDAYEAATQVPGNLDGRWIRAVIDSWDGSAPLVTGPAPGGPAPGGIAVETLSPRGGCDGTGVLRLIDPGDPSDPEGTSLATEFPAPFDEPNNRILFLGLDTAVSDRNLLREGVTFSARWRVNPPANSPDYLAASATGDGSPLDAGRGQVGFYFTDDGTLGTGGAPAALTFALETGNTLDMSTNPVSTLGGTDIDRFLSVWVTVVDPEGDDTYNINLYLNGQTTPASFFGTGTGLSLQPANLTQDVAGTPVPYFGPAVGNFLAIGSSSGGQDVDLQFDSIAYKRGVHVPTAQSCGGGGGGNFRRADVNDDRAVNLTDGVRVLNFLFLGGPDTTCKETQDANDDGTINITDGVAVFNFLFLGGPAPPGPGTTTCGPDRPGSPRDFGCAQYTSC